MPLMFDVNVYLLRVSAQNQQGYWADPGFGYLEDLTVACDKWWLAVGHCVVVRGAIAFLEASHKDIRDSTV